MESCFTSIQTFTLVALAVAPFLLFFVARFKKAMKKATREVRKDQSSMFVVMQQGLESIRAVNAFGRQDLEENKLKKVSQETVSQHLKQGRVKSILSPVVAITVSVCTAFVLWRGANLVLGGAMTVGALTVFLWYMSKFFSPVQDLAKMTSTVAQVTVALERIQSILDTNTIIPEKPNAKNPGNLKGDIGFEHVCFAYDPESPVLNDFNFSINCGQRVGICGSTGSGKSTIVSLIARFYDPTSGHVLIDGMDITDFPLMAFAARLDLCCRIRFFFMALFRKISRMEDPMQQRRKLLKLLNWRMLMSLSKRCPMAMIHWLEKEVLRFPEARGNALVLPVRLYVIHQFLFLMNQQHLLIPNPKKL